MSISHLNDVFEKVENCDELHEFCLMSMLN